MRLCGVRFVPLISGTSTDPVDLDIRDGKINDIRLSSADSGTWVMPGLWDQHVHMTQWARTFHQLDLSAASSPADVLDLVGKTVREGSSLLLGDTLVGVGLWHSQWQTPFGTTGAPTMSDLDAVTGPLPTVLISADLHSAWFNSAAANRFAATQEVGDSGLVAEEPWFARMPDISGTDPGVDDRWVAAAAAEAAGLGVTGIVDFEFGDTLAMWSRRTGNGFTGLRVHAAVWPDHLDEAVSRGLSTGEPLDQMVSMGPLKVISDGSLNTRTAWCHDPYPDGSHGAPNLDEAALHTLMSQAHSAGITSAIHAIGDRANTHALDAFESTGAQGRIEHAQLLTDADIPRMAHLGVIASVQPAHLLDDRDTAEVLWQGRTHRAYRFADLQRAGVPLLLGSDAPVAPLDPWLAIAAACTRTRDDRGPWHRGQILERRAALRASVNTPALKPGGAADLVELEHNPLTSPGAGHVVRTICAGGVTFER